jgi:uncharacterized membrane protein
LAVLRETTTAVNREYTAVATLAPTAVLAAAVLVWAWRASPRQSAPIRRCWTMAAGSLAAFLAFRAGPAVWLQLADFATPGEPVWSTDTLSRAAGFALGAGLVALACWALYRAAAARTAETAEPAAPAGVAAPAGPAAPAGVAEPAAPAAPAGIAASGTVPAKLVVAALSLALAQSLALQLAAVTGFLAARRVVVLPRAAFKAMAWTINHEAAGLFAVVAACLALALAAWRAGRRARPTGANPAEVRLAKAGARSRRRHARVALAAYGAVVLTATVGAYYANLEPQLSPPEPFQTVDGRAVIALDAIDDGHLHRFAHITEDGTEVRFIVVKKNGVVYGVGLDACEICGDTGYFEKAGKIICRLCDVVMNLATIGFAGGCNPIPLDHRLDGANLTVQLADLEAASSVFA